MTSDASDQSEITYLLAQIARERAELLELKHKIQRLEKDLEHRDSDVKELRADMERQYDHYNELWRACDDLLMEVQTLRSQVPIRISGSRYAGASVWSGV